LVFAGVLVAALLLVVSAGFFVAMSVSVPSASGQAKFLEHQNRGSGENLPSGNKGLRNATRRRKSIVDVENSAQPGIDKRFFLRLRVDPMAHEYTAAIGRGIIVRPEGPMAWI
jgi:hypothetical protein